MCFTVANGYYFRLMYYFSTMMIILLCVLYFCVSRIITLDPFACLLVFGVFYELIISYFNQLFIAPIILVDIITWPFLLATFYDYSKRNSLPKSFNHISVIGMSLVCLLSAFLIMVFYSTRNGAAIFATFYCMSFLPMILLTGSSHVQLFYCAVVSVLMLLSLKRSAFLIVLLGLFAYYIALVKNQTSYRRKLRKACLLLILIIAAFFLGQYIINKMGLNIIQRFSSSMEDGGSGRTRIWEQVLWYFNNSSNREKWLGHGFHAVFYEIMPLGISRYAHNSFLETLYDYGYIGLFYIISIVLKVIYNTVKMLRYKEENAPLMAYSVIPMIILGSVSYFFEQGVIIVPMCVAWGLCLGSFSDKIKKQEYMLKNY